MREHFDDDLYVDANGCPTERISVGGHPVIVHYDDIPESDLTVVRGIPCTTALRTVIDLAGEMSDTDLERMVADALGRGLFTIAEAGVRLAQEDMQGSAGAQRLRRLLSL